MQTQNSLAQSPLLSEMSLDEIRYSLVWEDPDLLGSALQVHSADHVLSIGSAGCNAFHLLLQNPASVTAVDLSPAQCSLLRLKKLAIEKLSFSEFMNLIGFGDHRSAWGIYLTLRKDLMENDRFFFDQRPFLFERGLSSQGRLESFFSAFREKVLPLIWSKDFQKALLRSQSLEEQNALLREHGNLPALRSAVEKYFGREGLTQGRSEAQMKYVNRENIGAKMFEQFMLVLGRTLISENHFAHFFLFGRPANEKFRTDIYQAAHYSHLQNKIDRLEIVHSDLETFLRKTPRVFSKMNLSDVFEYLSEDQASHLFKSLADKMSPGGRLAYWTLLVDRKSPSDFQPIEGLTLGEDRLWFYDSFQALEKAWLA